MGFERECFEGAEDDQKHFILPGNKAILQWKESMASVIPSVFTNIAATAAVDMSNMGSM